MEERGLEARSPHVAERFQAPLLSGAVADAPAFVPGLDDVAVVGQAIEEHSGDLVMVRSGSINQASV